MHKLRELIDELLLFRRNINLLGKDYLIIKFRTLRSKRWPKVLVRLFIGSTVFFLLVLAFSKGIIYLYTQGWSGFGNYPDPIGVLRAGKTLWDWMELLLIPLILAILAYLFRQSEISSNRELSADRQQEANLLSYFEFMQEILLKINLSEKGAIDDAIQIASARTQVLLRSLNGERKGIVLRFLYEAELISINGTFIKMERADLSGANYQFSSLSNANLRYVNLDKANLQSCSLYDAMLSGSSMVETNLENTNMHGANLEYAVLNRANLSYTNLDGASLIKAHAQKANFKRARLNNTTMRDIDLTKTNLSKANLTGAYLLGAKLIGANLRDADLQNTNLRESNLMYANLTNADLTGADLTNAIISKKQLRRAKSIAGAILVGTRERWGPPL